MQKSYQKKFFSAVKWRYAAVKNINRLQKQFCMLCELFTSTVANTSIGIGPLSMP